MGYFAVSSILFFGLFMMLFRESSGTEFLKRHLLKRDNITVGSETKDIPRIKPGTNSYEECYVSVVVYNSTTNTYGLPGAKVTVVSRTKVSSTRYNYTGYSQEVTNADGHACLPVYCRAEAIISVNNKGERLFAQPLDVQRSKLPPHFRLAIQSNGEEVQFFSYVFGTILGKTGPTYTTVEKSLCTKGDTTNYHFVFSYLSIPDELVSTPVPTKSTSVVPDPKTWYYGILGSPDISTCYLKLIIRAKETQARIELRSLNAMTKSNYGLFISGPKYNPLSNDQDLKAACLEFRCPSKNILTGADMNTLINGQISVPGHTKGCCLRRKSLTDVTANFTHFDAVLKSGANYGPQEGIFKHVNPQFARSRCFTGRDFLGRNYTMIFDNNTALEYDCTVGLSTCASLSGIILG